MTNTAEVAAAVRVLTCKFHPEMEIVREHIEIKEGDKFIERSTRCFESLAVQYHGCRLERVGFPANMEDRLMNDEMHMAQKMNRERDEQINLENKRKTGKKILARAIQKAFGDDEDAEEIGIDVAHNVSTNYAGDHFHFMSVYRYIYSFGKSRRIEYFRSRNLPIGSDRLVEVLKSLAEAIRTKKAVIQKEATQETKRQQLYEWAKELREEIKLPEYAYLEAADFGKVSLTIKNLTVEKMKVLLTAAEELMESNE